MDPPLLERTQHGNVVGHAVEVPTPSYEHEQMSGCGLEHVHPRYVGGPASGTGTVHVYCMTTPTRWGAVQFDMAGGQDGP
jgi:hypothetical protein